MVFSVSSLSCQQGGDYKAATTLKPYRLNFFYGRHGHKAAMELETQLGYPITLDLPLVFSRLPLQGACDIVCKLL